MIIERQQDVTVATETVMQRTSDPRLREIMVSLVKHLHGFVRDVSLTEAEFRDAARRTAKSDGSGNVSVAGFLGNNRLLYVENFVYNNGGQDDVLWRPGQSQQPS